MRSITAACSPRRVTTKRALVDDSPREFLAARSTPYVTTRTTATTGRPAEVWLSRYEMELWPAVAALSGLLRGGIAPSDCMQVNISSRATAAVQQNLTVCRLVAPARGSSGSCRPRRASTASSMVATTPPPRWRPTSAAWPSSCRRPGRRGALVVSGWWLHHRGAGSNYEPVDDHFSNCPN